MKTIDFDYPLPNELIAQTPAEPRDSARLLVLHRDTGAIEHRVFREIVSYLGPEDVLVRNDTRVVPGRLHGRKAGTGGKVQALLLRQRDGADTWEALVKPAGRLHTGTIIEFDIAPGSTRGRRTSVGQVSNLSDQDEIPLHQFSARLPGISPGASTGTFQAEVIEVLEEGTRVLRFPPGLRPETLGEMPLPPYIREPVADPERYQTVYAREPGSAAAPTAGLHFTPDLLTQVQANGVEVVSLTLHIGLDTFRPVRHDDPQEHGIHREYYHLAPEAAERLNAGAVSGKRFIATGTTSVRSLEDAAKRSGWTAGARRQKQPPLLPYAGLTGLYILPGYDFLAVDALITNFHLPRTTLLMLVSAFAGRELILQAYEEAVRLRYRFYSFGDALLIL